MNTINLSSFHIALVCLAILQVADWYTTRTILARGGYEANPIIKKLMSWLGVDAALAIKGALLLGLGYFYCDTTSVTVMAVIYVAVIVNNVRVMQRLTQEATTTKGA
jgi:Domain of unknown function (DUF5658)